MPLPPELQELVAEALEAVQSHPEHALAPSRRLEIYNALGPKAEPPSLHPVRGWLAIITARRALPIWQQSMPSWKYDKEDGDERGNISLPERVLALAEGVVLGTVDVQVAWKEACEYWYMVESIATLIFFEQRRNYRFRAAFYACEAASKALHESLGLEFLGKIRGWEQLNDEQLPDFASDAASSAVAAYAAREWAKPIDPQKRREFWDWWLSDAIPEAWERGQPDGAAAVRPA